jgi:hypothetical protein
MKTGLKFDMGIRFRFRFRFRFYHTDAMTTDGTEAHTLNVNGREAIWGASESMSEHTVFTQAMITGKGNLKARVTRHEGHTRI